MYLKSPFFAFFLTFCQWNLLVVCFDNKNLSDLIQSPLFVDKTEVIAEFLRDNFPKDVFKYYFITRPRGFGKTTNLQLIRTFAAIEVDDHGKPKPQKESSFYESFKNTTIGSSRYDHFFERHFNQYPVIYLDLEFQPEELLNASSRQKAFCRIVQKCFEPFEWMKKHLTSKADVEVIEKAVAGELDEDAVKRSLYELCAVLRTYFNKQEVILLVDNFDSAVNLSVSSAEYDNKPVYQVIQEMLLRICGSKAVRVEFAMITGVTSLNFHLPGVPEGTKHFSHYPFLKEDRFVGYYGIAEEEMSELQLKLNVSKNKRKKLMKLHRGYVVQNESKPLMVLFNPIFVKEYFAAISVTTEKVAVRDEWASKEPLDYADKFAHCALFRKIVVELMRNGSFSWDSLPKDHQPGNFQWFLESPSRDYRNFNEEDVPELLTYIFERGWLSHDAEKPNRYRFPTVGASWEFKRILSKYMDPSYIPSNKTEESDEEDDGGNSSEP